MATMKKILMTTWVAALIAAIPVTTQAMENKTPPQSKKAKVTKRANPLLKKSALPFGAPDFKSIRTSDYLPAIKEGIRQQRANIAKIVASKQPPTFKNTIVAYEQSGVTLDRVTSVFFALAGADKTEEIARIQKEVMPLLTDLENDISFNADLLKRIKYVYEHEYATLQGEDKKLLEVVFKNFVRSGALLSDTDMARMKQINLRISELQQEWSETLPNATNNAVVWVSSKEELAGLSEADIAQCKKDAESRGGKAPYCIVIVNTTQQPLLASLDNRDLRRRVYEASIHRADGTNEFNTYDIVAKIASLRAEQGKIMGYDDYASYALEKTMAKTTDNVYAFLRQLISEYKPKAEAETKAIEEYARKKMGSDFQLQPYDRFYFSAKMKQETFNFSEDDVKPYFNIDSVQVNGVFYAAHLVYGLTFKERKDIPTYHPDMKVFEVKDKDGRTLALFYSDYFRRPTKRGGAWMSSFAKQSGLRQQIPIIYNVCNNAKAPEGQPSLISVERLWHATLWKCRRSSTSRSLPFQRFSTTSPSTPSPDNPCPPNSRKRCSSRSITIRPTHWARIWLPPVSTWPGIVCVKEKCRLPAKQDSSRKMLSRKSDCSTTRFPHDIPPLISTMCGVGGMPPATTAICGPKCLPSISQTISPPMVP